MRPNLLTTRSLWCLLPFLALLTTSGCSTFSKSSSTYGEEASPSDKVSDQHSDKLETIVLFSTGNIQGALLPSGTAHTEPGQGGAALLESYYRAVQHDYGSRAVWLDAGNLRGHSLVYDFDRGKSFESFVHKSGIAVTLDGNPPQFEDSDAAPGEAIASSEGPHELPKDHPSHHIIDAGRVKLGVVSGQTTDQVTEQASLARRDGADLVVWLSNAPIQCNPRISRPTPLFRKPGDPIGFCEGPLNRQLSNLAPGTIQAVITSGAERQVQNYIYPRYSADAYSGIAVVQASPFGRNIHLIYLTYDLVKHQPVGSKTRIEGPVMVCSKVFRNQGDCDDSREAPESGRGTLVRSRFHGKSIEPDAEIQAMTEPAQNWIRQKEKEILAQNDSILTSNPAGESALADLVADALRAETQADFAIVNPGLIKHAVGHSAFHPGPISEADLDRALPADTPVYVVHVTGEELKTLVRISESGMRGFAAVSGMKLELDPSGS